jgi:hypothetical protein
LRRVGSVEPRKPQDDAYAAPPGEPLGRRLRVQHGPVVPRRRDRRRLVDPGVPRARVRQCERLLDEPPRPAGERAVDEVGRGRAAHAAVLPPGPGQEHPRTGRDVGREVDHDLVPRHGPGDGARVEQVQLHRPRPSPRQRLPLLGRAPDGGHLVPRPDQRRHDPPAHDPGRSRDEDPHGTSLLLTRYHT